MHAMMPLLKETDFPAIKRSALDIIQINLGYKCNLACLHCHVNASPKRKEMMDKETIDLIFDYADKTGAKIFDVTGGAPEMNPHFKYLVKRATENGIKMIDRCNLTIMEEDGYEDIAEFLAEHKVEIVASLPCYSEDNVDAQRGDGVFQSSIRVLQKLNKLGYGSDNSDLSLNLVYNPVGASLPPEQEGLQAAYKSRLFDDFGIQFNQLFTIANMPIARFGSTLVTQGKFENYMDLLKGSYSESNLEGVMCKSLISVDYQGYVYDCDFHQMLNLPLGATSHQAKTHLRELFNQTLENKNITIADHCYGCTAGQGSSCGGALS